jgi:hypothetical protein
MSSANVSFSAETCCKKFFSVLLEASKGDVVVGADGEDFLYREANHWWISSCSLVSSSMMAEIITLAMSRCAMKMEIPAS